MRAASVEELEEFVWVVPRIDGGVAAFIASGNLNPRVLGLNAKGHDHAGCNFPAGLDLAYAVL